MSSAGSTTKRTEIGLLSSTVHSQPFRFTNAKFTEFLSPMNRHQAPNHALQRTGSAVTAPAADHHRLSAHRQVPRPLRLSLSLGSFGDLPHVS